MVGLGAAEGLHLPGQQGIKPSPHVGRLGGQPDRVHANHESSARRKAAQSPAAPSGQEMLTRWPLCSSSTRISPPAAAVGVAAGGVGASSVSGTNAGSVCSVSPASRRQRCTTLVLRRHPGHRSPSPPARRNDLALEFGAVGVSATPRDRHRVHDLHRGHYCYRKVGWPDGY